MRIHNNNQLNLYLIFRVFFLFLIVADCPKVLTLYGMSNLVSESEHSLDLMDPYQRDAKTIGKNFQIFPYLNSFDGLNLNKIFI
jgi:hypothetical protein